MIGSNCICCRPFENLIDCGYFAPGYCPARADSVSRFLAAGDGGAAGCVSFFMSLASEIGRA